MGRTLRSSDYYLVRKIGKAINDYKMIQDKDRVLVGVSGGKDSLTLLSVLHERKKWVPIDYDVVAVNIQSDYKCSNDIDLDSLRDFFEKNNYEYHIHNIKITGGQSKNKDSINCFWCSWNRRKCLFELAVKFKYNKVALGHHLDDIVQTILLNLFYQAEISAMVPKVRMFNGELDIIRPLAYVEEKEIIRFAKKKEFPVKVCKCPNSQDSQRTHMRKMIEGLEKVCPHVKKNIFNSLKNIKKDYLV